jgi:hypothetical protein
MMVMNQNSTSQILRPQTKSKNMPSPVTAGSKDLACFCNLQIALKGLRLKIQILTVTLFEDAD